MVGCDFINEISFWLKQINGKTNLRTIAIKAFMVLPALVLQKPSVKSKVKDHRARMEKRMDAWRKGDLLFC